MALYGLIAVKIKTAWYLGEACTSFCPSFPVSANIQVAKQCGRLMGCFAVPAMMVGILLGPYLADLLNATRWAVPPAPNQLDEIALGVMRIMIAIQL